VLGSAGCDRQFNLAAIGACLRELGRDLLGHVARLSLGGVESDDANWREILTLEQMADWRREVGAVGAVREGEKERVRLLSDLQLRVMFGFRRITKENRVCSFLNKELPAQDRFLSGVTCLL
jgi:hypothetical protein